MSPNLIYHCFHKSLLILIMPYPQTQICHECLKKHVTKLFGLLPACLEHRHFSEQSLWWHLLAVLSMPIINK